MTNKKTKDQLSAEERERLEMLAAADEETAKGAQYTLDEGGGVKAQKEFIGAAMAAVEDPEKKYRIYYNGIQKLLLQHLPKGKKFEKQRGWIYDEKNIFLSRGKAKNASGIRGGDGRMTFQPDMQQILDEVVAWILSRGTMVDIYDRLWQLNERMGYPHQSNFVKAKPGASVST